MRIAVIPARGGSKRIPRKNIKKFNGKPMIVWSIQVALDSKCFDRIIVSTDDDEIANIANASGAETPFVRPADLADDHTPTKPVISHAIRTCKTLGWNLESVCCIYPCAPLLLEDDLCSAQQLLSQNPERFIFPVGEYPHPIQRALRMDTTGTMRLMHPEYSGTRTQDLETSFHDAGQFYFAQTDRWLDEKPILTDGIGLPIPHWRVADIDTPEDWNRAEIIHQYLLHN